MEQTERIAGVSSDAVRAKTGKGWDDWFAVLDAAGAQGMPHSQIARLLSERHGVPDWWCQMVTVGYEQARGLRQVHEKADGFAASASRTIAAPVARLFTAWADAAERAQWLPDAPLQVRKATPGKSLRIVWDDGTPVDVNLTAKGERKSRVAIQHGRLPGVDAVAMRKAFWSAALERLKEHLES